MTLPYEEKIAVNNTRLFLTRLLIPQLTKKIPGVVRREAGNLLKHYPYPYQVDTIFKHYFDSDDITCPKYFLTRYTSIADEYHTLQAEIWNDLDRITAKSMKAKKRKKRRK